MKYIAALMALVLSASIYAEEVKTEGPKENGKEQQVQRPRRERPQGNRGGMNMFDLNGDKKITKEEMLEASQKQIENMFKMMDKNNDGVITEDEMRSLGPQRGERPQRGGNPQWNRGERPEGAPRAPRAKRVIDENIE